MIGKRQPSSTSRAMAWAGHEKARQAAHITSCGNILTHLGARGCCLKLPACRPRKGNSGLCAHRVGQSVQVRLLSVFFLQTAHSPPQCVRRYIEHASAHWLHPVKQARQQRDCVGKTTEHSGDLLACQAFQVDASKSQLSGVSARMSCTVMVSQTSGGVRVCTHRMIFRIMHLRTYPSDGSWLSVDHVEPHGRIWQEIVAGMRRLM